MDTEVEEATSQSIEDLVLSVEHWQVKQSSDLETDDVWEGIGKVHDWRNHIPDVIAGMWGDLPVEAKAVAFYLAAREAENEEWE